MDTGYELRTKCRPANVTTNQPNQLINEIVMVRLCVVNDLTLQTLSKGGDGFLFRHKLDSVHETFLRKAGCRQTDRVCR